MKIEFCVEFEAGPDPFWYYTKGHIDKGEFLKALREYLDSEEYKKQLIVDCQHQSEMIKDGDRVDYEWWRFQPTGIKDPKGCFIIVKGPGRGNFPVTVYDVCKQFELIPSEK